MTIPELTNTSKGVMMKFTFNIRFITQVKKQL